METLKLHSFWRGKGFEYSIPCNQNLFDYLKDNFGDPGLTNIWYYSHFIDHEGFSNTIFIKEELIKDEPFITLLALAE